MDAKAEKVALFRYGLIAPLVLESLPRGELTRRAQEIAARHYEIRFSQCKSSRSSWLIAIRSILQPCGCQEELSTWLKAELFIWPRHALFPHTAAGNRL
jgi:hypothetical protein